MNKKVIIVLILLIAIITIIWLLSSEEVLGKKPFNNLKYSDVSSIGVLATPSNKAIIIEDNEQIKELVDILSSVVIYKKDESGKNYCGQLVQFTLTMKDGKTIQVGAYNPFIFIDGKCYRTKYEPCEKLNNLGNRLINL